MGGGSKKNGRGVSIVCEGRICFLKKNLSNNVPRGTRIFCGPFHYLVVHGSW